jgi:glycosyltransferase involved in cell wall biosynthesis
MSPTLSHAAIALYSNSPYQPTGYGQQAGYLVDRLKRAGAEVAALSNYGVQGNNGKLETKHGAIMQYAPSFDPYGNDIHPANFRHFSATHPEHKALLITLYDTWVLDRKVWDRVDKILSWTPLDHLTIPDKVEAWIRQEHVTPIAMSPFGVRQMNAIGIECEYVPHAIDTKIYAPGADKIDGDIRDKLGIDADTWLVGMVAANKADSGMHRKAFYENLLAFSIFKQDHPDAKIYIHSDVHGSAGGWQLKDIFAKVGIKQDDVIMPNQVIYRWGHTQKEMAALFATFDVYLGTSYGEGFGIGTIESASAGTPAIVSNFAASPDLIAPEHRMSANDGGLLVDGQPIWHAGLSAPFAVPNVSQIVRALQNAYAFERGANKAARKWATANFDVDQVFKKQWMPLLERQLK